MTHRFEDRLSAWSDLRARLAARDPRRTSEFAMLEARLEGVLAAVPEDQPWRLCAIEGPDGAPRPVLARDDMPLAVAATSPADPDGPGRFQVMDPGLRIPLGPSFSRAIPALNAAGEASLLLSGLSLLDHREKDPVLAGTLHRDVAVRLRALAGDRGATPQPAPTAAPPRQAPAPEMIPAVMPDQTPPVTPAAYPVAAQADRDHAGTPTSSSQDPGTIQPITAPPAEVSPAAVSVQEVPKDALPASPHAQDRPLPARTPFSPAPRPSPAASGQPVRPPEQAPRPEKTVSTVAAEPRPAAEGPEQSAVFEVSVDPDITYLFERSMADGRPRVSVASRDQKGHRRTVSAAGVLQDALRAAATDWAERSEMLATLDRVSGNEPSRPPVSQQAAQEILTARLMSLMQATPVAKARTLPPASPDTPVRAPADVFPVIPGKGLFSGYDRPNNPAAAGAAIARYVGELIVRPGTESIRLHAALLSLGDKVIETPYPEEAEALRAAAAAFAGGR